MPPPDPASPSLSNKRQRLDPLTDPNAPGAPIAGPGDDAFIQDHDAGESGGDEDEEDEKPKSDKKAGRRKIKIEFIQDKSRRHITFSKRKAGIMKKAYELSTLTGTQVLLLVVSETGLVYTFTTAKLQPLVTQPEGKNLIQACLNAPHGQLPSSMPVGTPIGRSSNPMTMPGHQGGAANVPGGLSIGAGGSKEEEGADEGEGDGGDSGERGAVQAAPTGGSAPNTRSNAAAAQGAPAQAPLPPPGPPQGPTTSPHARAQMPLPIPQGGQVAMSPTQGMQSPLDQHQHRAPPPPSPNYTHAQYPSEMYPQAQGGPPPGYGPPGAPAGAPYGYPPPPAGHDASQQGGSLANAHGGAWGAPPGVQQQYARR